MNKPQLSAADLSALTKVMAAFGAEAQKVANTITTAFTSALLDPQQAQEIKELAQKLQIIRDRKRQ
jgi:tRNA A-37 threonylcarbamoyl transferase component Bud32